MTKLHNPVTADDHIQGDPHAKITLVEYGDYQCPHCKMADVVVRRLQHHFGKDLRYVYRNFPLTEIHPMAEPAAEAAEFAAANGKFWEMHDGIFKHQEELDLPVLVDLAEDIGLDPDAAETAVEDQQFADRIERDMEGAVRIGVHATPTFFINGVQHEGSFAYDDLKAAIEAA